MSRRFECDGVTYDLVRSGPGNAHAAVPLGIGRAHVTEGSACWCEPDLWRLCTQCDGDEPGCWRCHGSGVVEADAIEPGVTYILVHHGGD